jgi:hypothetical protein
MERDEEMSQMFLKATTDALNDYSGGCIDKMVKAFSDFGFNVQEVRTEDGSACYVDGDEGLPGVFFKKG